MEAHLHNKDEELMGTDSGLIKCQKLIKSFIFMVSRAGLEPATTALKVRHEPTSRRSPSEE
jgi:hypothetical protein